MVITNENLLMDLEKKFLAYLFSDKRYIAETIGTMKLEYLPNTYKIYKLLLQYYNKYRDIIPNEQVQLMFNRNRLDEDTIVKYNILIDECKNDIDIISDADFNCVIDELKDLYKRREYISMGKKILEVNPMKCNEDTFEDLINSVKKNVYKIDSLNSDVKSEGVVTDNTKERWEKYCEKRDNPEAQEFIKTGFDTIDNAEGGFRKGELVAIIGRKGDGKSVLMLNLAHNAWKNGENVILFSLEISKEDYERRFDSRAANVLTNGLKMGTLDQVEEEAYKNYLKNLSKQQSVDGKKVGTLYIVDCPPGITPAFVESKVDTIEKQLDVKFSVIITDYAGIMKPNVPTAEKRNAFGDIALEHKILARTKNACVITAYQMSRAGKENKERAESSDVAESDQVGDHLDWGLAIKKINETTGVIESFKTRDAAPFQFRFYRKFEKMSILELDNENEKAWDDMKI